MLLPPAAYCKVLGAELAHSLAGFGSTCTRSTASFSKCCSSPKNLGVCPPRPPGDQREPREPDGAGRGERCHHLQRLGLAAARRRLDGGRSPLHQHAPGRE